MLERFKNYDLSYIKGEIIGEAELTDCILVDEEFEKVQTNIKKIQKKK